MRSNGLSSMERTMKKILLPVLLSTIGLAGCVAVPAYDAPYAYGAPAVYVAPPALLVGPLWFGGRGHRHGGDGRRWR